MTDEFLAGYLPYVLRRTDQALSAPFYQVLTKHGVQRPEWRVLAVLREHDSLSMSDLTTAALAPQPTVSHAVARLVARGLVNRLEGTDDRRHRFVAATVAGHALAEILVAEARDTEAGLLAGAGIADVSDVLAALDVVHARLTRSMVTHP